MSTALIAVVMALLLSHWVPALADWRRFGWFGGWRRQVEDWLGGRPPSGAAGAALTLLPPVLALLLVQRLFDEVLFGLPGFVLAVLVLFWCWGPRDLDRDVEAVVDAGDPDVRQRAAAALYRPGEPVRMDAPSLVEAVFSSALHRWFGVLLWFLLLGPAGALLYRLTRLAVDAAGPLPADAPLAVAGSVLDWPAAQLMTLALALAASFDAVFVAWRDWHAAHGRGFVTGDVGFLAAAARASVVCELVEDDELDPDVAIPPMVPALRDALSLVWRVLIVWLTVLALFVLAGFVS